MGSFFGGGGDSTSTSEPRIAPEFRPVAQETAQQALALQRNPLTSLTGPLAQTFAPAGTAPASSLQEFLTTQIAPSLVNPLPQLQAFTRAGQPLQPEVAALQAGDVGGRLGGGLLSLAQLQGPIAGGASVFPGLDISQLPALQAETARAFTQMPDAIRLGLPAGIELPPPPALPMGNGNVALANQGPQPPSIGPRVDAQGQLVSKRGQPLLRTPSGLVTASELQSLRG